MIQKAAVTMVILVNISPALGSQLDLDPKITVTFNQPMDKASVESNFSLRAPDGSQVPGHEGG